jgi:peptide/nickel transport system substrate-binding protein
VLRVELDPRAHFSDGRPVTGNDVKASIERLFEGKGLLLAFAFTEGTTVNVIDEHTVDIVTPEPFGPLESNLVYLSIIPESDARNPSVFKQRPLGSGPYTFVSYDNDTVTLEANPKYWKGVPGPKTVKLQYIEDPNARLNALLTGQIDIYTRGNSLALDATKGKHNFYVVNITPPSQFIYIPQYSGALNDVRVRQAIAYAIDRSSIAKKIIQIDPPAMSSLPAGSIGFRPLSPPFGFDLKKAQALLKEAGIEKGTKLTMASADIFQKQPEVDQVVKYSLEQLGFNVELTTLEAGKFRTTYPEYELSLNALGSQPDPDMLLSFFTPGTTEPAMHWNGHAFQPVLNKTRTTLGKAREGAIDAAAKYLWENQTVIYLTDDIWYTICSEKVREYTRPPTEMESWVWDATTV